MVDEAVVVDHLRAVNEYTNDLKDMRTLSKEAYLDDVVVQRAVERTFMNLIQACIDLAEHVRSADALAPSGTSKQAVEALGQEGIISTETEAKLTEAVGFRNVLAHRYGEIDHDIVYDVLHAELHWFEEFQQEVAQWLKRHE